MEDKKCYGCDEETEEVRFMRVKGERRKQPFCKECYYRLVRVKLGYIKGCRML